MGPALELARASATATARRARATYLPLGSHGVSALALLTLGPRSETRTDPGRRSQISRSLLLAEE